MALIGAGHPDDFFVRKLFAAPKGPLACCPVRGSPFASAPLGATRLSAPRQGQPVCSPVRGDPIVSAPLGAACL
jgi:hypothetical protein